ncbi:hypothetical protein [Cardinium endosymbiont of Bemisia tabaci]|uniref:hypothetical protein n=1 Tax=Candidatus Cardinium TaxID=273135 RepID=UPI0012ECA7EF|nr:hypothetical protein [Cardinium endosymbiont of Bemisia tabaci]
MKKTPKDGISKAIEVLLSSGVDLSTLFDQGGLLKELVVPEILYNYLLISK